MLVIRRPFRYRGLLAVLLVAERLSVGCAASTSSQIPAQTPQIFAGASASAWGGASPPQPQQLNPKLPPQAQQFFAQGALIAPGQQQPVQFGGGTTAAGGAAITAPAGAGNLFIPSPVPQGNQGIAGAAAPGSNDFNLAAYQALAALAAGAGGAALSPAGSQNTGLSLQQQTQRTTQLCSALQVLLKTPSQGVPMVLGVLLSWYFAHGGDWQTLVTKAQEVLASTHLQAYLPAILSTLYVLVYSGVGRQILNGCGACGGQSSAGEPKGQAAAAQSQLQQELLAEQYSDLQKTTQKLKLLRYQIQRWQAYADNWQQLRFQAGTGGAVGAPGSFPPQSSPPTTVPGAAAAGVLPPQAWPAAPAQQLVPAAAAAPQPQQQDSSTDSDDGPTNMTVDDPSAANQRPPSDEEEQDLSHSQRADIRRIRAELASGALTLEDLLAQSELPVPNAQPAQQMTSSFQQGVSPPFPATSGGTALPMPHFVNVSPELPPFQPAFAPPQPQFVPPQPNFGIQNREILITPPAAASGSGAVGVSAATPRSLSPPSIRPVQTYAAGSSASPRSAAKVAAQNTPLLHQIKTKCSSPAKAKTRAVLQQQQTLIRALLDAHDRVAKSAADKYHLYLSLLEEDKARATRNLLNAAFLSQADEEGQGHEGEQEEESQVGEKTASVLGSQRRGRRYGLLVGFGGKEDEEETETQEERAGAPRAITPPLHLRRYPPTGLLQQGGSSAASAFDMQPRARSRRVAGGIARRSAAEAHDPLIDGADGAPDDDELLSEQLLLTAMEAGTTVEELQELQRKALRGRRPLQPEKQSGCVLRALRNLFSCRNAFCAGISSSCCDGGADGAASSSSGALPQSPAELSKLLYEGAEDPRLWVGEHSALTAVAHHRVNLAIQQLAIAEQELMLGETSS